jgi:phosphoglycerate dehydrogenase-like enzyme
MPAAKPRAAFFCDAAAQIKRVYGPEGEARVQALTQALPGVYDLEALTRASGDLAQVQLAFSTWGMPQLGPEELAKLPQLKAVFYAAGSVQSFARPLLERGITVVSAWAANAEPVAEFTLAQILLAGKSFLPASQLLRLRRSDAWNGHDCAGNYGATVALLGAGMIGRRVIELLKPFAFKVLVFDPFLTAEAAAALGVEKVGLDDAFARGQVVSNHLADVPETRGLLRGVHFLSMPDKASFLNTGRGATVNEAELWQAMKQRPDLIAILDVTEPEPPHDDSPAYKLDNVFLAPHIAGSLGNEVRRLSSLALDECEAWLAGKPLRYSVSLEMLEKMA